MTERNTVVFDLPEETPSGDIKKNTSPKPPSKMPKKNPTWTIVAIVAIVIVLVGGIYSRVQSLRGGGSSLFSDDYIAVIDVDGEISSSTSSSLLESSSGYNHTWTMDEIDLLIKDSHNKGIFIRVNSPGGSVYTSDEIYYKLLEYREKTGRPIYSYMESMAASGGYYISAPCDKIYANRNCWTGSIGVTVGTSYDISGLLENLGIKTTTITSGKNKSMGSSTEEYTEEQQAIMQSLVDEAYEQFVDIVAEGRNMSVSDVKKVADGRIYSAKQAKKLGLIDDVMNEDEALAKMKADENLDKCKTQYLAPDQTSVGLLGVMSDVFSEGVSGQLSEYQELMSLAKNGNVMTISYMAPIQK